MARHPERIVLLLKEMWDSLSEEAKQAVSAISAIAKFSRDWKFYWGREECSALIGADWEDLFLELKGKCFLKETEPDIYDMHELISDFAFF